MKVVLRFDASSDIGLGHLSRMLSLGEVLKECSGDGHILYAVNSDDYTRKVLQEENARFIEQDRNSKEDFTSKIIEDENPDVIVFDQRYSYRKKDIIRWKNSTKLVSIDYIGEDYQLMDKIIIPNAHFERSKYPRFNNILSGPEYAIINKDILKLTPKKDFPKEIRTIAVTTGGSDPEGVLIKLIPWLKEMKLDTDILVFVGAAFKFKNQLDHLVRNLPGNFHVMPYSSQELIKGDMAICTFGLSIYEMIYLQIPAICISHNMENAHSARVLRQKYEVIEDMGYIKDINPQNLHTAITRLLTDKVYYMSMAERCSNLIDGKGAERVAQIIYDLLS